jgi:hypothetical protein
MALEARYGVTAAGFNYNWHIAEPRFDLSVNRNELKVACPGGSCARSD